MASGGVLGEVILVVGCTGAGKTTYARALAEAMEGQVFSIDDWMTKLFWMDSPEPIDVTWTLERIDRCEEVIWMMARQAAMRGMPAILDLGFTKYDHRQKFRDLAREAGLTAAVHFLDGDEEVRWERVRRRNVEQGDTYVMTVDRAMFDFMEFRWQPPKKAEWSANNGRRIAI